MRLVGYGWPLIVGGQRISAKYFASGIGFNQQRRSIPEIRELKRHL